MSEVFTGTPPRTLEKKLTSRLLVLMKRENVLNIISIVNINPLGQVSSILSRLIQFLYNNKLLIFSHVFASYVIYHAAVGSPNERLSLFFATIYLTTCIIFLFLLFFVHLFVHEKDMSALYKFLVVITLCLLAYEINQLFFHLLELAGLLAYATTGFLHNFLFSYVYYFLTSPCTLAAAQFCLFIFVSFTSIALFNYQASARK